MTEQKDPLHEFTLAAPDVVPVEKPRLLVVGQPLSAKELERKYAAGYRSLEMKLPIPFEDEDGEVILDARQRRVLDELGISENEYRQLMDIEP